MAEREPISGSSRDYGATSAVPNVSFADFSPTELYNLSEGIADNVNSINSGLNHDTQQTVNGSVSATARDIQRLGVVVRRGDKPQKLQVERLTQAFTEALAKYSSVQKARLVQFETSMLLEKEAYINKIEADVLDVNQIIQELADMVNQQAQSVDNVESNIESAGANVEAGVDELAKAAEYQRRYRRKMLILIIIGVIVAIIFIVWVIKAFR
ncbi:hypothetical protein HF086_004227 [Spodoptera exigua]|uniref:t-SNARE coiled-coil homology domain-containing protein n=1 Tax=Spodoptera exigua TaxID=7107 RepID=A0A922SNL1_SPOEX|nr:hypothetical protein HF086_004227 [Spodoptera exigua]